jgi:hypothetical protein
VLQNETKCYPKEKMRKRPPSGENRKKSPVFAKAYVFNKRPPSTISRELRAPLRKIWGKIIDFGGRSQPSAVVNVQEKISRIPHGTGGKHSLICLNRANFLQSNNDQAAGARSHDAGLLERPRRFSRGVVLPGL